jgi:hypothetical protein
MEGPTMEARPAEISDDELTTQYLTAVNAAARWATTEEQRDSVMSALYDVLVAVGPHDGEDVEL